MQKKYCLTEIWYDITFAFLHFLCKKIHTTHSRKFTAPAPEKQTLWRGSKFSLAMQKRGYQKVKTADLNKILQISKKLLVSTNNI